MELEKRISESIIAHVIGYICAGLIGSVVAELVLLVGYQFDKDGVE